MMRIFDADETVFTSNGRKILLPTYANVHKEDNSDFYLDVECGLEYADYIVQDNIIIAPTPSGEQPFRVNSPQRSRKKIKCRAWHLSHDAENYILPARTMNMNCSAMLSNISTYAVPSQPFSMTSDISGTYLVELESGSLWDALLAVTDKVGGHLVRNGWDIAVNRTIGSDNGVVVRYGKNLKAIEVKENWDDVVTVLYPIGKDGITVGAVTPNTSAVASYDVPYTKYMEFSQSINKNDYSSEAAYTAALRADLTAQAQAYVNEHQYPKVTYTLNAAPEKLFDVGDTVVVIDERLGLTLKTNVISYDYNCLLRKFKEIVLGNTQPKMTGALRSANQTISKLNTQYQSLGENLTNLEETVTSNEKTLTIAVCKTWGGASAFTWKKIQSLSWGDVKL